MSSAPLPMSPSLPPTPGTPAGTCASTAPLSPGRARLVHFSQACEVIPPAERRTRPKLFGGSVSLPLWRKRAVSVDRGADGAPVDEDGYVVLRVPVPRLGRTQTHDMSAASPPTPILRHAPSREHGHTRVPSSPTAASPQLAHRRIARSPSLSRSPTVKPAETVPLRACCAECAAGLAACTAAGAAWEEPYTRGARRRRALSVDSAASQFSGRHRPFHAVRVDEAAGEGEAAAAPRPGTPPPRDLLAPEPVHAAHAVEASVLLGPSLSRRASAGAILPEPAARLGLPTVVHPAASAAAHPPPIAEEDEEMLFPLPRRSPRGTPSPVGTPSPAGSGRNSPAVGGGPPSPALAPRRGSPSLAPGRASPGLAPRAPAMVRAVSDSSRRSGSPLGLGAAPAPGHGSPRPMAVRRQTSNPGPSPRSSPRTRDTGSWASFFRAGAEVFKGVSAAGTGGLAV